MKMQDDRPEIKQEILTRVRWLYIFFFCVGLLFTCRIVYVIFFSREIADNAVRMRSRIVQKWEIPAMRGSILARNGEPLASSMFRYQVEMEFWSRGFDSLNTFAANADSLSKLLSAYFGDRTPQQYRDFFINQHNRHYRVVNLRDTAVHRSEGAVARFFDRVFNREYVRFKTGDTIRDSTPVKILPREVDYNEWKVLSKYPILNNNMGMTYRLVKRDCRIYPQGELARRTVGVSDDEHGRRYGIEEVWREELAGVAGMAERQRIAPGFYSRVQGGSDRAPIDGADVVTTLDLDLQDVADKALRRRLEENRAIRGTTIVMDVPTGEILAMVNLGRTADGRYSENRNYALSGRMEPGSTLKLASLLALLEDAGCDLSLTYDSGDGRMVRVGAADVKDSHSGYSKTDLKTATAQSLNVFFAKAIYEAYKNNPSRYTDFLSSLHLDRCAGLEAYGELPPVLTRPGEKGWSGLSLPNLGYGYAIELAPIQTITLYNAVANNGRMVAPRLVREIRRNGECVERFTPVTLVRGICSDETLRKVRECLEEVALTGTASYYFGDTTRYRVGAKTGTAKVAQNGIKYSDGYYLGSMVTYLPAEKPAYTIMTAVYTRVGYGWTYYGAGLAGPTQKEIADYIYSREYEWHDHRKGGKGGNGGKGSNGGGEGGRGVAVGRPVNVKSGDIAQMRRVARRLDVKMSADSRSGWGSVRRDSTGGLTVMPVTTEYGRVPDVRGMGLKEALFLLENAGLSVTFRGCGAVATQSLTAGAVCREGDKIEITLK